MKNIFIAIISLLCCISTLAQITVTSSTLPALGDTLHYAWAYNQPVSSLVTPPGFDLSWDFTGLTADTLYNEIYLPVEQGQFAARFPTADLLVIDSPGERYYQMTSAGLYLLGHSEKDLFGYPFNVMYKNNGFLRERFAPLDFFNTYSESTSNFEGFRFVDLPAGLQAAYLNAGLNTTDSMRLRVASTQFVAVDAYGIATVPGPVPQPQYAVLRQRSTLYTEFRIDAKVAPLGWLDITDLTYQWVPGSRRTLGVDTSGTHIFFNDATKEEIARITLDAEGRPIHVRYKNNVPAVCASIDGRPQNIWTGNAGNIWENAANWSCGAVPATNTDVFVNSGSVVINSTVIIRSLQVNPGAQVTIGSGSLQVLH